tara:strand:- start:1467 stop:1793 length:327 start_codon:yes stop_codon:yes gene_type:complete
MEYPDWITSAVLPGEDALDIETLRVNFEIHALDGGILVINNRDCIIDYAVVEYGNDVEGTMVWHGTGVGANLRECRHSYFGEDGYVFYMNGDLFISAINKLKDYFDMD